MTRTHDPETRSADLAPGQSIALAQSGSIRHGFFTRAGGVSGGLYAALNCGLGSRDDAAAVLENRARVARHLGSDAGSVVTLYQVHGATARSVTGLLPRDGLPEADAVVTRRRGLVIGVLTADCAPILLADAEAGVVAAAHAGWRGAVSGVAEAAIAEMERQGAERARIVAAVGPCINQAAYEVGPDFQSEVSIRDPDARRFFATPPGGRQTHFDLPAYVAARLARCGLAVVEQHCPCTYENESGFFSYRRSQHRKEDDYGRQISAIVVT